MSSSDLPKLGAGGSHPATVRGHTVAVKHFDAMIEMAQKEGKGVGPDRLVKPFVEWTKSDFGNENIFGEFAYY